MGRWAGASLVMLLAGCAGTNAGSGGGTQPVAAVQRPVVAVTETVNQVDRGEIVGNWACREINPLPGHAPVEQVIRYENDGKGTTNSVIDASQVTPGLSGRFNLDFAYDWAVEGDKIIASNVLSKATPADSSDSSGILARLTQVVVTNFGATGKPGAADVLQQSHDKFVMKAANVEGGPVLSCSRSST